jgi:protein SCO1
VRRLLVLLVLALSACSTSTADPLGAQPTQAGTYRGTELDPAQPRPTFTLTDTAGKPYDFAARTRGQPTLLFFGFTHCPDICPTTLADAAQSLRSVDAALRDQVTLVFVTTDPKRDTGPAMAAYLRNFDTGLPRFVGLTGTVAQVEAAQAAARVPVAEDAGQTHSTELLFYGADDYARVAYLAGGSPDDLAHDLPLVLKGA